MVTVQQVYDMAIHLMDEQNETTGATMTADTQEYKFRTISILNSAIPVLYPYSGNYKNTGTGRPVCRQLYADDHANPDFEQSIPLDDALCLSLLPHYLAGQLLSSENDVLSSMFMNQYREMKYELRDKVPASFEAIPTPYGLF